MIISAKLKFGIEAKILEKLKKDNDKIKSVSGDVRKVIEFVEQIGIDVQGISYSELKKLPSIMETYGLFGKDALVLAQMQRFNLKYLLTSDKDFDKIDFIEKIDPLETSV